MLIGIGGLSGVGKDHCTNVLTKLLDERGIKWKKYAFGDKVKELCADCTNTNLKLWYESELKDEGCHLLAVKWCNNNEFIQHCVDMGFTIDCQRSMRWWMQNYSDWLKIKFNHPTVFVNYVTTYLVFDKTRLLKELQPEVQIVTDVRYKAEVEALGRMGGRSTYILNPEMPLSDKHKHNSELLTKLSFQHVIVNIAGKTCEEAIKQQWEEIIDGSDW